MAEEKKVQSLSDLGFYPVQEPPGLASFIAAEKAAAESMSDQEAFTIHNEMCAEHGWPQVPTLEEFVKEWLK